MWKWCTRFSLIYFFQCTLFCIKLQFICPFSKQEECTMEIKLWVSREFLNPNKSLECRVYRQELCPQHGTAWQESWEAVAASIIGPLAVTPLPVAACWGHTSCPLPLTDVSISSLVTVFTWPSHQGWVCPGRPGPAWPGRRTRCRRPPCTPRPRTRCCSSHRGPRCSSCSPPARTCCCTAAAAAAAGPHLHPAVAVVVVAAAVAPGDTVLGTVHSGCGEAGSGCRGLWSDHSHRCHGPLGGPLGPPAWPPSWPWPPCPGRGCAGPAPGARPRAGAATQKYVFKI